MWWTPDNAVFALPPQISLSNRKWRTILAGSLAALVSATRNKRLVRSTLCIVQLEVHFARASSAGLAVVGSVLSGSCYAIAVVRLVAAHELRRWTQKCARERPGWKRDLPDRSSRPRRSAREMRFRGNFCGCCPETLFFSFPDPPDVDPFGYFDLSSISDYLVIDCAKRRILESISLLLFLCVSFFYIAHILPD